MSLPPVSVEFLVALLAVSILLTWVLAGRSQRRTRSRRGRRAANRGLDAEVEAEHLLERRGYRILERQVQGSWPLRVDGEDVDARLRADLLVGRRSRVFVAEVKTGPAARASSPNTRRQLLEYLLAFECDGVLLVDMDTEEVLRVEFPLLE